MNQTQPHEQSASAQPRRMTLTSAQQGMWYAQQLDPGNPTYQVGQYLDLQGSIEPRLMSIAMTKMVRDIDSLSMRFAEDDGGPYAYPNPPAPEHDLLEVIDLRDEVDQRVAIERAKAQMNRQMNTPRDLAGDELFGAVLFRLAGDRALLFQRVHHIMLDGYSAVVALRYLARVYSELADRVPNGMMLRLTSRKVARTAARTGSPFPSHEALIDALHEYRSSAEHGEDEAFWRAELDREIEVEGLEGTNTRAARRVVRAAVRFPEHRAVALRELGRDMPETMVGLIAIYLAKITGRERVSLGLPVTARRGKVLKSTPSMLSSILPVLVDVPSGAGLTETLKHAGDKLRSVAKHQRFRVQDISGAPSHPGPSVNLLPVVDSLSFGSATGEVHILSTGPVQDLSFVISGLDSEAAVPTLQLEGDADLHTEQSLTEHADRLFGLIDQFFDDTEAPDVTSVRLVDSTQARSLVERGAGPHQPLQPQTVLDAFSAAAKRQPDDIAVVADDGHMSFAELDGDSTRLAHHLVHKGVGPGQRVGVRIERSVDLPLLVLAVLKAGGAYVPLDPEYPIDRVAGMIEDSQPVLLLTSRAQADRDRAGGAAWSVSSLAVDADTEQSWCRCADEDSTLPPASGGDLAYVIFTSGSTGRPKGVAVERLALRNLFQHHRAELFDPETERLGRRLKVAHTAGLSFDAAWDPLLWLFAGHQLHVVSDEVRRDPQRLAGYLSAEEIDSIETTPSVVEALVAAGLFQHDRHPHVVALGGEDVDPDLWETLSRLDGVRAMNLYGPTEATVDSLIADIAADSAPHLGTSVPNSRHYILDATLDPVPDRAVGELYLAGANVARGYVGQPGRSADSFVADPFTADGSRMYRTGDVVRRRHDGSLRFLSRIDDQVKIRGYRVELGEVEAAMRRQRGVTGAAAIVHGESPASRLIGYITSGPGAEDQDDSGTHIASEVRAALPRELPEYMVPSSVISLAELPLTANGKLDRTALPSPERSSADTTQQPRSAGERMVAECFAEVLGLGTVGVDEDFFAAGGHSLIATQLASRLSERFEQQVSVRDVFECRTVVELAERIDSAESAERPDRLQPQPRPDRMPVSLAQRRLWFLNQLEPQSSAYNIPIVLHLEGPLEVAALRRAFNDVVDRHEPLRTVFPYTDGEPVQQILDGDDAAPPLMSVQIPEHRLDDVLEQETLRPFDITSQTPLRVVLLTTGSQRHTLVVTMHHIASDGWSLAPFARDLSAAYAARIQKAAAADDEVPYLEPLPITYADFTLWQRRYLGDPGDKSSLASAQLDYWRQKLDGAPDELSLPRDRARGMADPTNPDQQGIGEVRMELSPQHHAAIGELAARHRTSLFMVLQTALAVSLEQYGAGNDVVIGTPVAGRTDPQLDELVGFFVNTLVLRTSLDQNPTLAELLDRVRVGNTEAYAHQDVPFDAVVEAVHPPRVADRHPIFQVMLSLQNTEPAVLDLAGVKITVPNQVTSAGVKTDLLVDFQRPEGDRGPLKGVFGYDRRLFDGSTAQRIADAFNNALNALVEAPQQHLSELSSSDAETTRLLNQQSTGDDAPVTGTVLDTFVQTAAEHPDAPALVDADVQLSYSEVDIQTAHTARRLQAMGVATGDRVAVALRRSTQAITMVLAALRSGAAVVPIDTAYPDERIAEILADSDPAVLITDDLDRAAGFLSVLRERGLSAPTVEEPADRLLQNRTVPPGEAAAASPKAPAPQDIAYLVYTSGTTGTPKGVQVPHAALANVLAQHQQNLIGPVQRSVTPGTSGTPGTPAVPSPETRLPQMLHLSGLGFDAAWDPVLWLIAGATLHIADDTVRTDAEAVVRTIAEEGIDVVETTPSYARQLVAVGLIEAAEKRRLPLTLAVGGEAVSPALWNAVADSPQLHGWNLYGPSEFTVDSVLTPIYPGQPHIGSPIVNVAARVLDHRLAPVLPGVEGELYLSGLSEAHGYRGRPGETAQRFIADPQGHGTRMYRTGDLVRRRLTGELEFVRRVDDQVKLRGHRIELAEVESAVERTTAVETAVVRDVTPGGPETAQLAAWITTATTSPADGAELRGELALMLPDYMVPTTVTSVPTMPLTPNGKVDVAALPEPRDWSTNVQSRGPRTPQERAVCAIVAEVLGVQNVGLDDNFFSLGGHSLLAVSLMGRLRDELKISLPLRTIFDAPTPAQILASAEMESGQVAAEYHQPDPAPDASRDRSTAALAGPHNSGFQGLRAWVQQNPRPAHSPLPVSSGQARLWFLNQLAPASAEYNVVLWAELEGDLDTGALAVALDDVVARHEILRTTYADLNGEPVQNIQPAPSNVLSGTPVDAAEGFDLSQELPLRAALVRCDQQRWRLELVIHHIATDGASLEPLMRDLAAAYTSRIREVTVLQRPLAVQYADVARREDAVRRNYASAGGQHTERTDGLDRWLERLDGVPTELELPADGRRTEGAAQPAGLHAFEIPAEVAARIRRLTAHRSASSFHGWLAGLSGYLQQIGAGDDVVIGSPSAGRTDPDVSDLVGFFVNTLPLRMTINDATTSFSDAVDRARHVTVAALEDESVPFERIVEAMSPERRLGRHPLFQTMLSVEEPSDTSLHLPGVKVTPLDPGTTGSAKMDLSFTLRPRPGEHEAVDGVLEYNAAMFSPQAARGLVQRWIEFLEAVADAPESPLVDISSAATSTPSLESWPTTTDAPYSVLEALAETVHRYPQHTAIVAEDCVLDFTELNARIMAIAAGITARGVRPGDVVALSLPRSADTVATLLAVWQAGAVVTPVDTSLPAQRIATMLRVANARLVIHRDSAPDTGGHGEPADVRSLVAEGGDAADADVGPIPESTVDMAQTPQSPAYLIFTSGTTGEPKGVQVPHGALSHLLASHRATLMPAFSAPRARMAHTAGVGFDAAMDPVLWLAEGHELHILGDATRRDPEALVEYFDEHEISAWETTPSYVSALAVQTRLETVLDDRPHDPPFTMLLGGEPLDSGLWTWLRERPAVQAWNLYGPTEVGVDSLVAYLGDSARPELGAPTTSTAGYVLNQRLRPTPPGSVGELWLAGEQLAHGYISRTPTTAEHFVADPFAADGSRMYRTGDLVVVHEPQDGQRPAIVSRGRGDDQVKIRGHRIELEEIEALLRQYGGVSQAVVRPVETGRGTVLGAWTVPEDSKFGSHERADAGVGLSTALRDYLSTRVPEYMVPVSIGLITAVPLTRNGKVDVGALPELRLASTSGRAPQTPAEEAVAEAFAEVLGMEGVTADDSFFELGGHSFVAQPTITAVNAALDSTLPVQALFEAPTAAGLATLAAEGSASIAESLRPILPLRRERAEAAAVRQEGSEPIFTVHPASGLSWKFSALLSRLETTRPILGLQMPGIAPDQATPPTPESLDTLLDEYIEVIRHEQPEGPYHLIGWSFGGRLAHHLGARLRDQGEQVALLAVLDAYPSEDSMVGIRDEQAMWRTFLEANGVNLAAIGDDGTAAEDRHGPGLDAQSVSAMLTEAGSPLGQLPEQTIESIVHRFHAMGELFDASSVPVFDGDMHLFEATHSVPETRPSPRMWEAYVTGELIVSRVRARHVDMLSDRALDDIAPVLNRQVKHSGHAD